MKISDTTNLASKVNLTLKKAQEIYQEGRRQEAEELLIRALKSDENRVLLNALARIQAKDHRWEESKLNYLKSIKIEEDIEIIFEIGLIEAKLNNIEEAIQKFRRVISLKEDHTDAWANLSLLLQETDPEEARRAMRRALMK